MRFYLIDYIEKPKGYSGERCNSTYDLSDACKNCGTGAKLVDRLITKGITEVKTSFFATMSDDFLISKELYKLLLSKGIKITNLKEVLDSKKNELPYYFFYAEADFPKSLSSSEGLITERQCLVCQKNGYFSDVKIGDAAKGIPTVITPLRLKYQGISKEFLESSELFNTWEHLGISNLKAEGTKVVRYARPMLIVSERIKAVFEEFGVKNAQFEEVIINN